MKGIAPIISSIIIVGIYLFLISLAYNWGMPMAEENLDIPTLTKSESFLFSLSDKMDRVISHKNKEKIVFDLPGKIYIDSKNNQIYFPILTDGTIYSSDSSVCFSKNCNSTQGIFGKDKFYFREVEVNEFRYGKGTTNNYYLKFRNLTSKDNIYNVDLITYGNTTLVGDKGTDLIIKNFGRNIDDISGGKEISTLIKLSLD